MQQGEPTPAPVLKSSPAVVPQYTLLSDPRQAMMRTLPYLIGVASFLLGSGIGIGWLLRGWWGTETKPSSPKGTSDTPPESLQGLID